MDVSFEYNGQNIERLNFDRNHHKQNPCQNKFAIEFISIANSNRYDIELNAIKNKLHAFNEDIEVTIAEKVHTQDSVSIFIRQKSNQNEKDNLYIEILMADSSITFIEKGYCELLKTLFNQNKKLSQNILFGLNCATNNAIKK
ncbi:MAG: hypothetical protein DWP95_05925 [Proteobacteria bacterium]|nr:MAG: hypothetical protein DWP95_05925 [Pseudomonadota bacterium]